MNSLFLFVHLIKLFENLPVSTLKIDKSFIDELSVNADGPIVKTVIDMGRNMNFTIIAEGIECQEHVSFLHKNNLNHYCRMLWRFKAVGV